MKVQWSIDIAAQPDKIWPFLIEPEKILEWCITLRKFEYTSGQRSGIGTPFYFEEKTAGRLMKLNFEVTKWTENEKIAFYMTSGNFVKGYKQEWTVEAIPTGSKFTFMEEIELPYGIIGRILGLFAQFISKATVKRMLTKLKSLIEE